MYAPEQVAETERRFADRTVVRDRTIKAIETIGPLAANPPDRIALRKARLEETLALPPNVTVGLDDQPPEISNVLLERILASNDLLNANFLSLAVRAARSVGCDLGRPIPRRRNGQRRVRRRRQGQPFIFTAVLAMAYAISLFGLFAGGDAVAALPALPESMLALLGISHAGYLTTKAVNHSAQE